MRKAANLSGKRFGRLTAVEKAAENNSGNLTWLCICDCGKRVVVTTSNLNSNGTRSCGCLKRGDRAKVEGPFVDHLHTAWRNMLERCYNPRHKSFKHYGGKGVTVCAAWRDFSNFYLWASTRYAEGLEIDREDGSGSYTEENCRFVTKSLNNTNQCKRKSNLDYTGVTAHGKGFRAGLAYEKTKYHLGTFPTIREAVIARNEFITKNNFPHKLQEVPE